MEGTMRTDDAVVNEATEAKLVAAAAGFLVACHVIAATNLLNTVAATGTAHYTFLLQERQQGNF